MHMSIDIISFGIKYLATYFYGKMLMENDVRHQDISLSETINKQISPKAFTSLVIIVSM